MPGPRCAVPLFETVREWLEDALRAAAYPAPARTRVALLLTGLVAGEPATVSGLSRTLRGLALSPAAEPSIARRLLRVLEDPRLDPARLLPAVFTRRLPELLAGLVAAHEANRGCPPGQHARFRPLRLIVDETSQEDAVHLLVLGLWYQGLVLPLAVRAWPQNVPLAADAYWVALGELCWEVHRLLPPVLRDHVLLLADRGYGVPRLLDLLTSLGWAWVVRVPGQARVQLPTGRVVALRDLVPQAGGRWLGTCPLSDLPTPAPDPPPLAVFQRAGWRHAQVVGVWLPAQREPWLLLTNLPATTARLAEYAQRWAIERLFLCWKSHGWDLEAGRVRDAARLARLVSVLALATWWRLACAHPAAAGALAHRAGRGRGPVRQLALPLAARPPDRRPWPAKFSLFTWGRKAIQETDCRHETPPLDWSFPDWEAPPWPQRCLHAAIELP